MTNKQERATPVLLAGVEVSIKKAWKNPFFHLSAFWRGTKCHQDHFQWCHTPAQGSGGWQHSLSSQGLPGLCFCRGWDLSSSGSHSFQLLCRRTDLQNNSPSPDEHWNFLISGFQCVNHSSVAGMNLLQKRSAKQNPQSPTPGEEGMKLYLSLI